jgi:hypothetical protein
MFTNADDVLRFIGDNKVEVVNHGNPAQVEQVLAGTAVAGPAALPVTHVGEGVPNLGTLAPLCMPARGLLALRCPAARYRAAGRHALTYWAHSSCGQKWRRTRRR